MPEGRTPNVPEQYRGFALQPTRMALLLLQASPGDNVSMELFDDVGVQNPAGDVLASQTKSVRKTNPISDSSVGLWKTFANWSRAVRQGNLDVTKTTFEIYVNRKCTGKLAMDFNSVSTKAAAAKAFEKARNKFWGKGPRYLKKSKVAITLRPHLEEVFGIGDATFKAILPRFQVTFASDTPELDLHNFVAKSIAVEEHAVKDLICHLHGWVKIHVDAQLALGKSPVIQYDDFYHEMRTYYGRLCPTRGFPDPAPKPSVKDLLSLLSYKFVKQLEIIHVDEETIQRAMHCFFKSSAARTNWSDNHLVHEDSLCEFEESLKQTYRHHKTEVYSDQSRTDEALRGKLLYGKCDQHRCKLEEKEVPEYFIPGCYQVLANKMQIGWHPRFEELIT